MDEHTCAKCGSTLTIPTGKKEPMEFSKIIYIEYICDKCGYKFWVIEDYGK